MERIGAWTIEPLGDGLCRVSLNCPDRSINTFSRAVLEQLQQVLDWVEREAATFRGVFFVSSKPGNFVAGADIEELVRIQSPEEAQELARLGQSTFQRLEQLPVPTVALISGACLGGGLEFALACRYRVADDDWRTLLGFPEVLLGLIPAWGGTVRARRCLGLARAIRLVTSGERLNSQQAKRLALVDEVVPREALEPVARWFLEHRPAQRRRLTMLLDWNPLGRCWLALARRQVQARTRSRYPAPLKALAVFEAGLRKGREAQYEAERRAVAELALRDETFKLLRLFVLNEEAKRRAAQLAPGATERRLRRVAVVGAGVMGAALAALLAERGIEVRLKDVDAKILAKSLRRIRAHFRRQVQRQRLTERRAQEAWERLYPTLDYSGFRQQELVIEAVVEDLKAKTSVYEELFPSVGPDTVVATNTSSFSLQQLMTPRLDPERFLAIHFFNPPHQMRLVELAWRDECSATARAVAVALARQLGKTPLLVADCPGFLVNRLLTAYLNHVGYLLPQFHDPLVVERAMVEFGFPMGPLELLDLVGFAVAQHVARNLHEAYGPRLRPAPLWEELGRLAQQRPGRPVRLVRRTWLGRPRLYRAVRKAIRSLGLAGRKPGSPLPLEQLAQKAIAPLLNEGVLCLEEGVVQVADDIDLALVYAAGFPPFRGGPLVYGDELSWQRVEEILRDWSAVRPELVPCRKLVELAQTGGRLTRGREAVAALPLRAAPVEETFG
jgi:3-hydroxyacyl-CoA dehydrogenase/enoyl-CoA hydratase/3-hydroxybutyryl-CoA epimerase